MKGWGPKSSVCPSKPGKSNSLGGISRDFAGISRRRPKSLRKKSFVFNFWAPISQEQKKKAHKHKETHRTPPNSDPIPYFLMWGPLLLENKAEGATHIKNSGLHWGPLHSLCWYFFMCFFRFLISASPLTMSTLELRGVYWAQAPRTSPSNPPRLPLLRGRFGINLTSIRH